MIRRLSWLIFLPLAAEAQTTTATLYGFVEDSSGRRLTNASVIAEDPDHAIKRTASTDVTGAYRIAELPPGAYSVTASAPNLTPVTLTAVRLTVDLRFRHDFTLAPAGPNSSVTVTAPLKTMESESPSLGFTLERERITSLPLNRRDFLQLSFLMPGVIPSVSGSELSTNGSFAMHAGGGREEFNNFTLDGADNNDPYINRYVLQPSVDSIREFKILTNNYSAEYGRSAGAQVNVVTQSGANQFHGTAYEYLRNRKLDARNFFEGSEDLKYVRNQFGGSLSGPVLHDRAFFFVNYEALEERRGQIRLSSVPSAAERAGDLSGLTRPVIDPFTQRPFPGNQIPVTRINPVSRQILNLFPANGSLLQPVYRDTTHNLIARNDFHLTNRDELSLRYGWTNQDLLEPFGASADVPNFGDTVTNRGHNITAQHQRIWSAAAIQTTRFAFGRSYRDSAAQNAGLNVGQLWNVNWLNVPARDYGYPLLNVAGYSTVGDDSQFPLLRSTDTYQIHEQFALIRGRHALKAGGEIRNARMDGYLDYFTRGSISFSGAITGSGIGDLLLGFPSFALKSQADNRQSLRTTAYNLFVQDDWRLTPRFNLSLGVRYEYNTPPTDPQDRMYFYVPSTGKLAQVGTNGIPRSGFRPDRNNFAPRLGFAWNPTDRWVVRGGYGLFYDSGMLVVNSSLYFNPPYFTLRAWFPTAQALLTLNDPFPTNGGITPAASPNTFSPDLTTAYFQQYNFTVERQLSKSTTFTVAYAGSKGTHLIRSRDLNQPRPGPGAVQARRANPAFAGIFFSESGGNSNYNSLQAHLDRRFSKNFSLIASYTYSKSIDDTSAFLSTNADENFPQDSSNFRLERALSSFDMRQRFSAAAVYMLKGFELRTIATAQSGQPFTPILRFDNSNTGNSGNIFGNDRPNVLRNPNLGDRTADRWFDTSAFAVPAQYTFGNAGRNIVTGPGLVNFDVGVSRRFRLTERAALVFDAQAFNVFNRANFDLPGRYVDEPSTFGRALAAKSPRQIQFALRFAF